MYRGLLPAMDEQKIADECGRLADRIAKAGDEDFQPADIVELVMSEVYSVLVIIFRFFLHYMYFYYLSHRFWSNVLFGVLLLFC